MAFGWTNHETFKFIELYQTCPEIWNPRHKCHKDKNKVNDAWTRIADEMHVPVAELKKKKDTLLAAFRINHKKVVASLKSGAGENEVYKPIWIFYDALAVFMSNVYECKSILSTEDIADANEDADAILDAQPSPQPQESKISSQASIPVQKRRCNNAPELAETSAYMKSALSTHNDVLAAKKNRVEKVVEDDCDLYGRLVANALRDFNEIDRLELRHEIDGLIIKKKRSPSQIIVSSNRPSTSNPDYLSSPCGQYRPPSSRNMYSSPSPVSPKTQYQQNMSQHIYAAASPPDNETIESQLNMSQDIYAVASPPDNQSSDILHTAYSNAII